MRNIAILAASSCVVHLALASHVHGGGVLHWQNTALNSSLGGNSSEAKFATFSGATQTHVPISLFTEAEVRPQGLPAQCVTALLQNITCDPYVENFMQLSYRGSLGDAALTASVCGATCSSNINRWSAGVRTGCRGFNVTGANPILRAMRIRSGIGETCLLNEEGTKYCNDVIDGFTLVPTIDKMPKSELCSYCNVNRLSMMQSTPYSVYDETYKRELEYVYKQCGLTGPTEIPQPEFEIPTKPQPVCISDKYHTVTGSSDSRCNTIADKYSVASASIYSVNQAFMESNALNCSSAIPTGTKLCLPLSCAKTVVFKPSDNCTTIEQANGLKEGDLRLFNPYLSAACINLANSAAFLGNRLCLAPQSGEYNATIPDGPGNDGSNNGGSGPAGGSGYTDVVVAVPDGSTAADKTTDQCGRWHVVAEGDGCDAICVKNGIDIALFLKANPSLGIARPVCSSRLVVGKAYCAGPVYWWTPPE